MDDYSHILRECHACNGMLPDKVYIRISNCIPELCDAPILEIGTAHGAATTAIGLTVLKHRKRQHIYTVDCFGGRFSSRSQFGDPDTNLEIARSNLRKSGINDVVTIFKGTSSEFATSDGCPKSLSMLMLDADGRIDRDFLHYYSLLKPGGVIVIDDADDNIYLSLNHRGEPYVDLKHRITSLLVSGFQQAGLIDNLEMVENTLFCTSTGTPLNRSEFIEMCLRTYRELVFSPGGYGWKDLAALEPQASRARRALNIYNWAVRMTEPFKELAKVLGIKRLISRIRHS